MLVAGETTMDELRISDRPDLRDPILIAAFSGWNDAGEAATSALRFMLRRWRVSTVAEIDPEPFYDFTQARPRVRLEQGERVLEWAANKFAAHRLEGRDFDVVLLEAVEPHLAWTTYMSAVMEFCREFHVATLVTLGALLAQVSHTRPPRISGSSSDDDLRRRLELGTPAGRYEGPTGIVGTLTQAAQEAGLRTVSLWANVPAYLNVSPNPKGALALLERLNSGFEFELTLHDLEVFCARFDAQVAAAVEEDPKLAEYARRIEEEEAREAQESAGEITPAQQGEIEPPDSQSMMDDLEHFLREQRNDN